MKSYCAKVKRRSPMHCYHCSEFYEADAPACPMCGKERDISNNESANLNLFLNHELGLFVGTNTNFYMKNCTKSRYWNWSAFLFGGYWLIYRGMYAYLIVYLSLLLAFLCSATLYVWHSINPFFVISQLIVVFLLLRGMFACLANHIYLCFATRKIQKLHQKYPDDVQSRNIRIMLAGRTNLYFPIAISMLPLILILFLIIYYVINLNHQPAQNIKVLSYCYNFFRYLVSQHLT